MSDVPMTTVPAWIRFEVLRIAHFANVRFCSYSVCKFIFLTLAGTFTLLVAIDEKSETWFPVHRCCEHHFRLHAESTTTGQR